MSLLKQAIRSHIAPQSLKPHHILLRQSPKHFSTETPPQQPPQDQGPPIEAFPRNANQGFVYARLHGIGISRHTLKSDIINLLKANGLSHEDIKFGYSADFVPSRVLIKFPSRQAYDTALRVIGKKGGLYRCTGVALSDWNALSAAHEGKTLLLQGIPRNALQEDVERFLCGCTFDPSSIQMFMKSQEQQRIRMALVHFPTHADAMNALIRKHRGFCLNNQISVRVLH